MNRAQRRKKVRLENLSSEEMKRKIVNEVVGKVENRWRKSENIFIEEENRRTVAIYACSILALHEVFNINRNDCIKYIEKIDEIMGRLSRGELTYEVLCKDIKDKFNIIIDARQED